MPVWGQSGGWHKNKDGKAKAVAARVCPWRHSTPAVPAYTSSTPEANTLKQIKLGGTGAQLRQEGKKLSFAKLLASPPLFINIKHSIDVKLVKQMDKKYAEEQEL